MYYGIILNQVRLNSESYVVEIVEFETRKAEKKILPSGFTGSGHCSSRNIDFKVIHLQDLR